MEPTAERLFRRALEAAGKALRDLEPRQMPADLRRVAGRPFPLPPPLAGALLKGIDRYDWLREKALEAWPEADAKTAGPDQASALLLIRPPGWAARVASLAACLGAESATEAGRTLERQVATARGAAEEWKRRARAEKEKARGEAKEARERLAAERAARRALEAAPARAGAAHEQAVGTLRAELAERTAERDSARRETRRLKQAVAVERRDRAAAEARLAEAGPAASWGGDPVDLAAHLDRTAVMARAPASFGAPGPPEAGAVEPALRLPAPLRPDRREAVDWLIGLTGAITMIVDGYNLAFTLGDPSDPTLARERALLLSDRLRQVARGALRVVVVFDSRFSPAVDEARLGPVEVRFFAGEGGADRAIADLVAELGGSRVVVSTDRQVREAAEAAGALALWSQALADWWRRR